MITYNPFLLLKEEVGATLVEGCWLRQRPLEARVKELMAKEFWHIAIATALQEDPTRKLAKVDTDVELILMFAVEDGSQTATEITE